MSAENSYAVIVKTRSFKKPFRVKYIGANGEQVAVSQPLTSKWNCRKNIIAIMKFVFPDNPNGLLRYMEVVDRTKKKEERFHLSQYNGLKPI